MHQKKTKKVKLSSGTISMRIHRPPKKFSSCFVIANGAGAPMDSEFIRWFCTTLADRGVMTVSFNFPYQEQKKKVPDRNAVLESAYEAVTQAALKESGLEASKLILGGKSMGGRIATQIAERTQHGGLILLGYPLNPPGKPDVMRDEHLYGIKTRALFLSGDRDPLCNIAAMRRVVRKMQDARLYEIQGGDHSFKVPKSSGKDPLEVREECVREILSFISGQAGKKKKRSPR